MAFYYAADAAKIVEPVGHYLPFAEGSVVLSGGSATVTVPQAYMVKSAFCSSQTSNSARCSATSGNTFTITGTGTDRVDWLAVIIPKA
jgi:hypothetical protein